MPLPALVPLGVGLGKMIAGSIATDLAIKAAFKGLDAYADHKETQYYEELSKKRVESDTHKYVPKYLTASGGLAETAGKAVADEAVQQTSFGVLGSLAGIAGSLFGAARLAIPIIGGGIALVKGLLGRKRKKKEQKRQQAKMRENASRIVMMNPAFASAFPQHSASMNSMEAATLKNKIPKAKASRMPTQLTRSSEFTNSNGTRRNMFNH